MTSDITAVDARTQAQRWFARLLAPDCGDVERAAFARWRAADPAHDAAYRMVEGVWSSSADLREDPAIAEALQDALRPTKRRRGSRSEWWPSLAAAASVVLVTAAVLWFVWPTEVPPAVRYATMLGEQRVVTLEDGSRVVMDTNTELLVQFDKRARTLTLQQGQADFAVQSDAERAFVVHAAGGTITATGTQFQVRAMGNEGTVTLLEGQVVVANGEGARRQTTTLAPNERIEIRSGGRLTGHQPIPEAELASLRGWTEGNLVVKEWTLATAVQEMNRYSATKLRLAEPSLGDIPVSGVFKAGDQTSFALALEYGWSLKADQRPAESEIILSRK